MTEGLIIHLTVIAAFLIVGHALFGRRWIPDGLVGIVAVYVRLWQQARHLRITRLSFRR